MENLKVVFAANLIAIRKQHDMSQLDLGEKLNYSDKSVSKWESGNGVPDIYVLLELAKLYGVTLNDLVSADEPKPIADKNIEKQQAANTHSDSAILSDVCSWHKYYVLKYVCKDTKCADDSLSKGRDCRFKMYIILEGEPAVLPALRFEKFIDECIKTGYEVLTAGVNEHLKIKIPDEFFNIED